MNPSDIIKVFRSKYSDRTVDQIFDVGGNTYLILALMSSNPEPNTPNDFLMKDGKIVPFVPLENMDAYFEMTDPDNVIYER